MSDPIRGHFYLWDLEQYPSGKGPWVLMQSANTPSTPPGFKVVDVWYEPYGHDIARLCNERDCTLDEAIELHKLMMEWAEIR